MFGSTSASVAFDARRADDGTEQLGDLRQRAREVLLADRRGTCCGSGTSRGTACRRIDGSATSGCRSHRRTSTSARRPGSPCRRPEACGARPRTARRAGDTGDDDVRRVALQALEERDVVADLRQVLRTVVRGAAALGADRVHRARVRAARVQTWPKRLQRNDCRGPSVFSVGAEQRRLRHRAVIFVLDEDDREVRVRADEAGVRRVVVHRALRRLDVLLEAATVGAEAGDRREGRPRASRCSSWCAMPSVFFVSLMYVTLHRARGRSSAGCRSCRCPSTSRDPSRCPVPRVASRSALRTEVRARRRRCGRSADRPRSC